MVTVRFGPIGRNMPASTVSAGSAHSSSATASGSAASITATRPDP